MKKTHFCAIALALGVSTSLSGQNTAFGTNVLINLTSGYQNSGFGYEALEQATSAHSNTAVGHRSMTNTTTGIRNAAFGNSALVANTTGSYNTAVGSASLNKTTSGVRNTGIGYAVLALNTTGGFNTASGDQCMYNNTSGVSNTAAGFFALYKNTTGDQNVAQGSYALTSNSTGDENTAVGHSSLYWNQSSFNTAVGTAALHNNTTGPYNAAVGYKSMFYSTTGHYNATLGHLSLFNSTTGDHNTAVGSSAGYFNNTGFQNTWVGSNSGPNSLGGLIHSTSLGAFSRNTASQQVRIGSNSVTSIGGFQAWTNLSDGRFKKDVEEDVMGLEFINSLRPVSYSIDNAALTDFLGLTEAYKENGVIVKEVQQTGFIAQEVEALTEELGFTNFHGVDAPKNENDYYGIRYSEFVVPLVKSVQELSKLNEEQKSTIQDLEERITALEEMLGSASNSLSDSPEEGLDNTGFSLGQNRPNPFAEYSEIDISLPATVKEAKLLIFDLQGKEVLSKPVLHRNQGTVRIQASELEGGMYIYALVADNKEIAIKKMILSKL